MVATQLLELDDVRQIAEEVGRRQLPEGSVHRAEVQPTLDSSGQGALRILFVLEPGAPERIPGDALLKLLVGLRMELERRGEERVPIVKYATTDEVAEARDDDD
ncbi:hypothetical protein ACI7BZ_19425 [Xanthobacter sp. AM11]|uniref:hypothetical protein n=1 Tax=Xanthobacter sp. AM11 TaxID=3380643 RepID=UPI0039BF08B0